MTDIQAWLDEGRDLLTEPLSPTWLEPGTIHHLRQLTTHHRTALTALQAVLDLHHDDGDGWCNECSDGFLVNHPCPTVRAIRDAIGDPQ